MTANLCRCGCGRTLIDGYAALDCTERARQQLAEIAELVAPARDVAHRQTSGDGTGGNGTPGSRVPLDLAAGARLDAVQVALTGWAREIAETRSVGVVPDGRDVIVLAAAYITQSLEIARHKKWIDEMLREIADCLAAMRSVTAGRRERIYLGACGALVLTPGPWEPGMPASMECEGSVYGSVGASRATCKACGARHDQEARIAERAELARSHWCTAAEIAEAYGIPASTIRSWRHRELLQERAERDGHPLYAVADVLALIATSKDRAGHWRRETRLQDSGSRCNTDALGPVRPHRH